jgi:hypothetical protein
MDLAAFRASAAAAAPPAGASLPLQALWWDAKGDWDKAHYLHRKEPDLANARYWYHRAGRPPATGPLEQEWDALAIESLRDQPPTFPA